MLNISSSASIERDENDAISVFDLLLELRQHEALYWFLAQLFVPFAVMMERIMTSTKQKDADRFDALTFKWMGLDSMDAGSPQMERYMLSCINQGKVAASFWTCWGLPTDGGRIPGVKVQNSVAVLPDSTAFLVVPQVLGDRTEGSR